MDKSTSNNIGQTIYIGFYKTKGKVLWNLVTLQKGIVDSFTIPSVHNKRMAVEIIHELRKRELEFDSDSLGNAIMTLFDMSLLKHKSFTLPIKGTLFSKWHGLLEVTKYKKGMKKYDYLYNSDIDVSSNLSSLPDS